jgi:hypothetical protein
MSLMPLFYRLRSIVVPVDAQGAPPSVIAPGAPWEGLGASSVGGDGRPMPEQNPAAVVNPTSSPQVRDWIRRRARADTAMQAAGARRISRLPPDGADAIPRASTVGELIDALIHDHDQINGLLQELRTIPDVDPVPGDLDRRRVVRDTLVATLLRHEPAEQQRFWPLVRRLLPDGPARAATAQAQEDAASTLAGQFAAAPVDADEFHRLLPEVTRAVRAHLAYEDAVFLDLRPLASRAADT